MVTGATDGIGKGFCHQLAKQGLNVVLVSRSMDKLINVAKEMEEKYEVKTKVVDIDFTVAKVIDNQNICVSTNKVNQDAQKRLEEETKDLSVGVLVNNVGVSYEHPEYFLQIGQNSVSLLL